MPEPAPRPVYEMEESVRRRAMTLAVVQGVIKTFGDWLMGAWFLSYFAQELGARGLMLGAVLATGNLAGILRIVAPSFVNRSDDRKRVWVWASVIARVFSLGLPLLALPQLRPAGIDPLWLMVGFLTLSTIAGTVGDVAWLSWYADLVPESRWGRYFGIRSAWMAVPAALTTLVGGVAMDHFIHHHPQARLAAYATAYLLGTACALVSMVPLAPVPNLPLRRRPVDPHLLREVGRPFRDTNFRRYAFFWGWFMFASGFPQAAFNQYIKTYLALGLGTIGGIQFVNRVCDLLGNKQSGPLCDRFGNKPVMILGIVGAASGPLFWLWTDKGNWWCLWVSYLVWGLGWAPVYLARQNLMLKLAPQDNNVGYIAAVEGVGGICIAVSQIIGGLVLQNLLDSGWKVTVGGGSYNAYQLFFVLAWLARTSTALLVFRIREPGASSIPEMLRALHTRNRVAPPLEPERPAADPT